MNRKEIIATAKVKSALDDKTRDTPAYVRTIGLLKCLGLTRHDKIQARRCTLTLDEMLLAGTVEPRVYEVLPAIISLLPEVLAFKEQHVPNDLAIILKGIKKRSARKTFRGVPASKYMHWLSSAAIQTAKHRYFFYKTPPRSKAKTHTIGGIIRSARIKLSLTQKQLSEKHALSLRVIRDLEQGKMSASIKTVDDILRFSATPYLHREKTKQLLKHLIVASKLQMVSVAKLLPVVRLGL